MIALTFCGYVYYRGCVQIAEIVERAIAAYRLPCYVLNRFSFGIQLMLKTSFLAFGLLFPTFAFAQEGLILIDPSSGKYLGNLNSNQYDPNSVANPYGRYGSQYSQDSVNNPYGKYGSPYSSQSANNPYATQAPIIIAPQSGFGGFGN